MKKPIYYTARVVLVELETPADSQEHADAMLKHKLQMVAATNPDIAVQKMTSDRKPKTVGYKLEPLP